MKTNLTLTLVFASIFMILASCGSSKSAGCDAYGSVQQNKLSDLAKK